MDTFGIFIARRREKLHLSQRALGKKVSLSHSTISKIESGQAIGFKFKTFLALAEALKIEPVVLMAVYQGECVETEDNVPTVDPLDLLRQACAQLKAQDLKKVTLDKSSRMQKP